MWMPPGGIKLPVRPGVEGGDVQLPLLGHQGDHDLPPGDDSDDYDDSGNHLPPGWPGLGPPVLRVPLPSNQPVPSRPDPRPFLLLLPAIDHQLGGTAAPREARATRGGRAPTQLGTSGDPHARLPQPAAHLDHRGAGEEAQKAHKTSPRPPDTCSQRDVKEPLLTAPEQPKRSPVSQGCSLVHQRQRRFHGAAKLEHRLLLLLRCNLQAQPPTVLQPPH